MKLIIAILFTLLAWMALADANPSHVVINIPVANPGTHLSFEGNVSNMYETSNGTIIMDLDNVTGFLLEQKNSTAYNDYARSIETLFNWTRYQIPDPSPEEGAHTFKFSLWGAPLPEWKRDEINLRAK